MPEYLNPEEDEVQETGQLSPSALAILNQSEHAAMVQTANVPANRRKLAEFESKLMSYANHSQPIALLMFYSLPRANKQIIGPSVRFAEIVAPCWRNCAVGGRVIGDAQTTVTAQGVFIDYEWNMRNSVEVPRRITDKDGRRYSEDMIITTSNAATSVARRNAVLKGGVPQALWTPAYESAQLTAVGKASSHAQRVADAMEYLHKLGVTEWQIFNAVGVPGIKELETEHLVTLRVLCAEIKRGEKSIEQVFGSPHDKEIESLFGQLKMNMAQQQMLRNSYLGRAEELVRYLLDRLGPANQGTRKSEPEPEKQSTEDWIAQKSTPEWNAKQKEREQAENRQAISPLGTVKDGKTVTGADGNLAQQWDPKERIAAAQAESLEFERKRVAMAGEPVNQEPFRQAPVGQKPIESGPDDKSKNLTIPDDNARVVESAVTVTTADGGTSTVTTMSGGTGESKPRRGRPTREEMARRRAQEQGMFDTPELSEQEARRQVENVMEQSDQFSF